MVTRRKFLKLAGLAGAGLFIIPAYKQVLADSLLKRTTENLLIRRGVFNLPTQNPHDIPKYVNPLVIPPAMARTPNIRNRIPLGIDYYEIAVRQFQQQVLPPGMPITTVWSYGSVNHPNTFNFPAFTIEARVNRPVRVKWINQLVDSNGHYLPHLLPVDPTLHWANPPGGLENRDREPMFEETPGPYTGPVPIVTHVHGAHSPQESDGYAEAWFLPAAADIPAGFAATGTFYDYFKPISEEKLRQAWTPGSTVFQYPNNQRATTMWYHDHTLGMTRLNVYAGPAGFFILRGGSTDLPLGVLPGPSPLLSKPVRNRFFEIPIAIQDRSFNEDGSLFYPDTREFFDEYTGPYIPDTDVAPIWNPEFFGNTMLVNGKVWPVHTVEARRYRFRFLNGCNSRFLILKLTAAPDPTGSVIRPFWQIGSEGGFLPAPVQLDTLLMSPAERADVIVDFSGLPEGTEVYLLNLGPDEPYGGGAPGVDFPFANPDTTGQVMKFVVSRMIGRDRTVPPDQLSLPGIAPMPASNVTRQVSLNEQMSMAFDGPVKALLGTVAENGLGAPLFWNDPITENPEVSATETWEIYNHTEDAHPIHIHEVMFKVLNRDSFTDGTVRLPESWEAGLKDTVIAYPGEITRISATFDLPGLYVWHCHIVEHEDNEMMRPYHVGPVPPDLPVHSHMP